MELNMLRKALWVFLKPLITLITNLLNPEIGEEVLVELKKFNRKEPCWVKVVTKITIILRQLYADEVITAFDKEFWVFEIVEDANFSRLLNSVGVDLERLWMTEQQREDFCVMNFGKLCGPRSAGATFFLHKKDESKPATQDNLVVAVATVDSYDMEVLSYPRPYVDNNVWLAARQYRLVIPKQ
ncbi:MAG: hypothetical protein WC791_00345 [Candidatus Paceibacterota bacterium]